MANMIGDWKLVPELTTGHDEFADAVGMSDKEREATRSLSFTYSLSRDGEEWRMKVVLEDGTQVMDVKFKMGVPFHFLGLDKVTKYTNVIVLRNDHFIEKLASELNGVIKEWDADTYRDGDFIVTAQTKDGKTQTEYMRKI